MKKIESLRGWGREFVLLTRYAGAGVFNTVFGLAVIFLAMKLGASPELSNALGYVLGYMLSFFVTKKLVFQSKGRYFSEAAKFTMAFVLAFIANLFVLKILLSYGTHIFFAQISATCSFTLLMYTFTRFFVFNR